MLSASHHANSNEALMSKRLGLDLLHEIGDMKNMVS